MESAVVGSKEIDRRVSRRRTRRRSHSWHELIRRRGMLGDIVCGRDRRRRRLGLYLNLLLRLLGRFLRAICHDIYEISIIETVELWRFI